VGAGKYVFLQSGNYKSCSMLTVFFSVDQSAGKWVIRVHYHHNVLNCFTYVVNFSNCSGCSLLLALCSEDAKPADVMTYLPPTNSLHWLMKVGHMG
jgi:hypothetical protein